MLRRLRMTTQECIDAYLQICEKVFSPRRAKINLVGRAYDIWNIQGRFDSNALAHEIQKVVAKTEKRQLGLDPAGITKWDIAEFGNVLLGTENVKCKTFVCAVRDGFFDSACLFRTYASPRALDMPVEIWEAARATSAATSFFDPIAIGPYKTKFVDGGLKHNNPVRVILDEAIDQWPGAKDRIQCFVSVGTGEPHIGPVGNSVPAVLKTLKSLALETEGTAQQFARDYSEWKSSGKYFRFNVDKGLEDVGLEDHKKISIIAQATDRYMEDDDRFAWVNEFAKRMQEPNAWHAVIPSRSLSPDQISYLAKYYREVLLEHTTSSTDLSNSTISLPTRLFNADGHIFRSRFDPGRPQEAQFELRASWAVFFHEYRQAPNDNDSSDPRRRRVKTVNAPWLSGPNGAFLCHIPVSEIWRLITAPQSQERYEPGFNPYGVSVYLTGTYSGEPLVKIDPGRRGGGIMSSEVAAEDVAKCAIGRAGLTPNGICGERFSNELPGLEKIFLPWALFFTDLGTHIFFRKHVYEAMLVMRGLLRILYDLWDLDDADDLHDGVTPVKVLLEDYIDDLKRDSQYFLDDPPPRPVPFRSIHSNTISSDLAAPIKKPGNIHQLRTSAHSFFVRPGVKDMSFETEDALNVLKDLLHESPESSQYDANYWIGFFGEESARWICLAMTLNAVQNLSYECNILSRLYDVLIDSPSGMCYVE